MGHAVGVDVGFAHLLILIRDGVHQNTYRVTPDVFNDDLRCRLLIFLAVHGYNLYL